MQQLSHEVFPKRHWGVMAESETFAHLEHLVHAGEAERWDEDGLLMYRVVRSRRDDATKPSSHDESADLLAQLIRNQCVNDGTPESGFESRSADVLAQFLGDTGLDLERYTTRPGTREPRRAHRRQRSERADAVADGPHRRRARHADGWQRDPFGGELVDGEVWGRGAVDMLNLTATMAVAFRNLARSGFTPRGTLVYLAVADEENLGTWGAEHLLQRRARRGDGRLRRHRSRRLPDARARTGRACR